MKKKKKKRERRLSNYSLGYRFILDTKAMTVRYEKMSPDEIKDHNKAIN